MEFHGDQLLVGSLLALVLVGVANAVILVLARQLLFATVNAAACLVALWCMSLIFRRSGSRGRRRGQNYVHWERTTNGDPP